MWLYIGPEVIAPVLSVLATLGGVVMMFWQRLLAAARSLTGAAEDDGERGESSDPSV
jgi:hypothetical protein